MYKTTTTYPARTLSQIIEDLLHLDNPQFPTTWQEEAEHFIEAEKIVSAVKVIRDDTGWGLLECKKCVDFYRDHGYWDTESVLREIIEQKSSTITQLREELVVAKKKLTAVQDILWPTQNHWGTHEKRN
jgi:hypothetical protein